METCIDKLEQYFAGSRIYYEIQEHHTAFTAQEVAALLHERGIHVAKVFIARADGRTVMLVLPAIYKVDFDRVREMIGARDVRRAKEVEFAHLFPDCDVGAMPPFGNMYDIPVYVDKTLAMQPFIVFQAGSHRETMKMATSDYMRLVEPTIGEFAVQPEPEMEPV